MSADTAIVHAFGLDERTVANWRGRAGTHCEKVHKDKIEQGNIDLKHVQADEIRVKGRGAILWMALAIMVPTRLWVAGTVSDTRDRKLTDGLMQQVRRCCKSLCTLLVCTDGFAAYPNSIQRAFREKVKNTAGRGRCRLEVWKDLHIGTVIKRTVHMHLKKVDREMARGSLEKALKILQSSKGGTMLNTSFIERLNGTMRERLAALTGINAVMPLPMFIRFILECISLDVLTILTLLANGIAGGRCTRINLFLAHCLFCLGTCSSNDRA